MGCALLLRQMLLPFPSVLATSFQLCRIVLNQEATMKQTHEYDGTRWAAGDADRAAILGGNAAGFLIEPRMPIFVGAQVDGVCSRRHRWHTAALFNRVPFCIRIEMESDRRAAAKGGVQ